MKSLADRLERVHVVWAIASVLVGGLVLGVVGVLAEETAAIMGLCVAAVGQVVSGLRKHQKRAAVSRGFEVVGALVTGLGVGGVTWIVSRIEGGAAMPVLDVPIWAIAVDAVLIGGVILAFVPGPTKKPA